MKRTGAVIEARLSSSRLPGKVLTELMPGWAMIDIVVGRAQRATRLDGLVVATTVNPADDPLVAHLQTRGITVFRGSEADVMGRSLAAGQAAGFDVMVRLTGDNPLIDGHLLDDLLAFKADGGYDYVATTMMGHSRNWAAEREFPRGISAEAFDRATLEATAAATTDPAIREYTTFGIYDTVARWRLGAFPATGDYAGWKHPELRFTVDTPEDLELARRIFNHLGGTDPTAFGTVSAVALVAGDPALQAINANTPHNVASELRSVRKAKE